MNAMPWALLVKPEEAYPNTAMQVSVSISSQARLAKHLVALRVVLLQEEKKLLKCSGNDQGHTCFQIRWHLLLWALPLKYLKCFQKQRTCVINWKRVRTIFDRR